MQIVQLDEGTKARNRAYQDRIDEVWRSTAGFEAKLRTEAKEAVETILNMKENYQNHIDKWNHSLQAEINGIFDKLDNELIPKEKSRVDVIDSDLDIFVKATVPAAIERQSGEVGRQLRRAYETFEIEKKKEMKRFEYSLLIFYWIVQLLLFPLCLFYHIRETKLVEKASKHMQNTAQRFDDENALMSSCFFNLEDDIFEYERHAIRMHLIRNANSINAIATLNAVSSAESTTRAAEDVEVLDTVIETQKLLQQMVRREKNPLRLRVFFCILDSILYSAFLFYFTILCICSAGSASFRNSTRQRGS